MHFNHKILYRVFIPLSVMFLFSMCRSSESGTSDTAGSLIKSDKPDIDTALVLDQIQLYRAKRYETIGEALQAGPEKVYKLVLWGKKLGEIPPEIGRLKDLQTLDVAFNDLSALPDEIADLHYLQGFYANGNKLYDFPGQLILLPVLKSIDLSENVIREIPASIVRMDQLTRLSLDKNSISEIPAGLYRLSNLSVLELAGNDLGEISGEIGNLKNLKKLDLANNHIKTVPEEVTGLSGSLKDLMLQGNPIPLSEIERLREAMPMTNIRF